MDAFVEKFFQQSIELINGLDKTGIANIAKGLSALKARGGRLFVIGSGGGAGHASHAVNDFRKLVGIEAYSPSDNVSELTARTNDEGWDTAYSNWLKVSRINKKDGILVFSVGGGDLERNISANLVRCVQLAKDVGASIYGVVGRKGGYTAQMADACVIIPEVDSKLVTPHTEGFQAVVWHCLVSHPMLDPASAKWGVGDTQNRLMSVPGPRRAVFLDRDGVLIRSHLVKGKPIAISDGEAPEIIAGVEEACALLRQCGFLLVMVTNQPDVAAGKTSRAFVENTNRNLTCRLRLEDSRVCFHSEADNCECRKPLPGLLRQAAAALDIALDASFMVGDRWKDVNAGNAAGCRTIFLDHGYIEPLCEQPHMICHTLLEAAWWISEATTAV